MKSNRKRFKKQFRSFWHQLLGTPEKRFGSNSRSNNYRPANCFKQFNWCRIHPFPSPETNYAPARKHCYIDSTSARHLPALSPQAHLPSGHRGSKATQTLVAISFPHLGIAPHPWTRGIDLDIWMIFFSNTPKNNFNAFYFAPQN